MSSSSFPKLPAWIFYATDVALLAAASFVAAEAPRPLPNGAIFAIVACVIAGAVIALVPRVAEYEREKNAALDERQRALEALAQTVTNSAEQIGVAAQGLHAIAELSHKNLRHAEQLPHKLQDKIAEFQAQLANVTDAEKEEMEKELVALRSSESERLESISDRIAKSTAELTRVEAALHKQLSQPVARLTAPAIVPVADQAPAPAPTREPSSTAVATPAPAPMETPSESAVSPSKAEMNDVAHPPKRVRKTRRDETTPASPVAGTSTTPGFPVTEPPPVKLHEIAPVVPGSQAPYSDRLSEVLPTTPLPAPSAPLDSAGTTVAAPEKAARKRSEKKSAETAVENLFGIEVTTRTTTLSAPPLPSAAQTASEFAQVSPDEAAPAVAIAADGATRLLVTAYIGIGNRLFIRGDGPGLSWEKGVPLQFVSIGKWRWETADATRSIKFKLYKNDQIECTSLGVQSLTAGHQQELAATF